MTAGASPRGKFITLEGGEGAGKSTQIRLLGGKLRAAGHEIVATREPGGSPGADAIRALLVEGDTDRWDPMAEALLHFAARRDHLQRTVWPALAAGRWVLCDRFADSTMAYQGYGHGLGRQVIASLYATVVGDFAPDLTLILDLPVEEGLARAAKRDNDGGHIETRYERMGEDFHMKLRDGFLDIAKREPARCVVIDAAQPKDQVAGAIFAIVAERFGMAPSA